MNKKNEEKISIEIFKPEYLVGQVIYIPQRNKVVRTDILGYGFRVVKEKGTLLGVISSYHIPRIVFVRRGENSTPTNEVRERDFYTDAEKAKKASRFLRVKMDDESWKLAIGDREVEDENSPYNIENCKLPLCCGNISDARDILLYCKKEGGLIVHERNTLAELITAHGLEYESECPLRKILKQLRIF